MVANVHPIVEVSGLVRRYAGEAGAGVSALDGITFTMQPGEFTAITGPSGCGKSTLLNLLAALDTPDEGSIKVGGLDLARAGEAERTRYRREDVGIVFQFFNLLPGLTLVENVALPLRLQGVGAGIRHRRARDLLEFTGLAARESHFPHQLSGGEMQRAAVARALIHQPKLVIADEPTGNLDSAATDRVLQLLRDVHANHHTTLVLVTHSETVAAAAERQIRLCDGQMVADERMADTVFHA